MKYVPKEITEEVNVTPIPPLQYFAKIGLILSFWGILLYLISGAIADQAAQMLDPKLEAGIGKSLVAPLAVSDIQPKNEQHLQALLEELQTLNTTRLPPAQIHIIESEAINAGVLPGGQMIITTALLNDVQSENELTFILAHELGHHQLRHPSRRLGRSLLWLIVLSFLGLGNQTPSVADPTALSTIADLQFSRTQEQQADRFALELIVKKYGHIEHSLDLFQRLEKRNLEQDRPQLQVEFLETHPFPHNRIIELKNYAKQRNWKLEGTAKSVQLVKTLKQ